MTGKNSIILDAFPREFEHRFWTDLDRRFYSILLLSWTGIFTLAVILSNIQYDPASFDARFRQAYLEQIRLQPGKLIIEDSRTIPEQQTNPITGKGSVDERRRAGETGQVSARERIDARRQAGAERLASRKLMEKEVSGMGVLGVLSSGSQGGTGESVADILGIDGAGPADLEGVISNITGMAVLGQHSQRTHLGRGQDGHLVEPATVNELISGIGSAQSLNIGRKGSLEILLESANISGAGARSAYRNSDAISRIINEHNDAVEYCYKRELKLDPNIQGNVVLEFVIEYTGRVNQATIIQSTIGNPSIEKCILSRVRGWRFNPIDKTEGSVTVRQKYIFG